MSAPHSCKSFSRRPPRLGGEIALLHRQRHNIPVRRPTRSRRRHRNLRRAHCRRRRHCQKSRSRSCPCRRRSGHCHRRRVRHHRRRRIHPRPAYRAIRTAARDRPGYALVGRELLPITSRRPRVTRLIRKQHTPRLRIHRHRCCAATTACDPAARNQRHQSKPQANRRDPGVEMRLAASLSPDSHNPHHDHPHEERVGTAAPESLP